MPEDVGVELPPGDLVDERLRTLAPVTRDVSEQGPRVDAPEMQVGREPARTVQVGPVPIARVVRDPVTQKGSGALGRESLFTPDIHGIDRGEIAGYCHPCARQARENGVNTRYGSPSGLRSWLGVTAYADPVATSSVSPSAARTASSRRRP